MPVLYNNNIEPADRKLLDGLVRRAERTKELLEMADNLANVVALSVLEGCPKGLMALALKNYRDTRARYDK